VTITITRELLEADRATILAEIDATDDFGTFADLTDALGRVDVELEQFAHYREGAR